MKPGDWVVLCLPPDFVRRGRVVRVEGVSMTVRWMGDDEDKVLPWAGPYVENGWLEQVEAPAHLADEGGPQESSGLIEVAQVAAMLGTTAKQVRSMLRSGKLVGRKEGSSWAGVESQAVHAVLKSRSGQVTA